MLKLLWSWVLLVVIAAFLFLYQPGLLTAKIELSISGAEYVVQAWFVIFMIMLLIISVYTIANMIFFWQRKLLVRKCHKYSTSIKALHNFFLAVENDADDKNLNKLIKLMPIPPDFKVMLKKSFLQEIKSEGSLLALFWHGSWQRFSELICYGPIKSVWVMQACAHVFLQGGFQGDLLPSFIRSWELHSAKMFAEFPTLALQVQLKLFQSYSLTELEKAWDNLPRRLKKQDQVCLAYVKALAEHKSWLLVQSIAEEQLTKNWDKFLGEWYFKTMPAAMFDIMRLQKWHKQAPMYLSQILLLALARAYAAHEEWATSQTLIERINQTELTFVLELELNIRQGNLAKLSQLIKTDFFRDSFA